MAINPYPLTPAPPYGRRSDGPIGPARRQILTGSGVSRLATEEVPGVVLCEFRSAVSTGSSVGARASLRGSDELSQEARQGQGEHVGAAAGAVIGCDEVVGGEH